MFERYTGLTSQQMEEPLHAKIQSALHNRYGPNPDIAVRKRVAEEWAAIKRTGIVATVAFLHEIASWARKQHVSIQIYPAGSLILYLLGVTLTNPLPSHSLCLICNEISWEDAPNGLDLSVPDLSWLMDEHCACECGSSTVVCDGHDIPLEMVFGGAEDFTPHFHIVFEEEAYHKGATTADTRDLALSSWRQLMISDNIPDDLPAPRTFAELIANFCLIHGAGLWNEDAKFMVERMQCSTVCLLHCQEDVFRYYTDHGYSEKEAWIILRKICSGEYQPYFAEHTTEMVYSKDAWLLNLLNQQGIRLLSKAYVVEYIMHHLIRLL